MGDTKPCAPDTDRQSHFGLRGAIPVKKGLVVDFYRMKTVIAIDQENLTATVQQGITWEKLDAELKKQNLTINHILRAIRPQLPGDGLRRHRKLRVRLFPG